MGINFQNVSFKYSDNTPYSLKNINLSINPNNEFVCILGHTGSGKSTLVQHMNALLLPCKGQITCFSYDVVKKIKHKVKLNTKQNRNKYNIKSHQCLLKVEDLVYNKNLLAIRKHIGLVFQFPEYQLFETTVIKDVMFGPKNFGLNEKEAYLAATKACELVGLSKDLLDKSPFALSGGQMRRVAIAGILALNPDIIILDEPTVGLDPIGKEELMKLLVKIQKTTNKSIIMITHDMNIVGEYAKRVIVMDRGEIVYDGNKRTLFEDTDKLHKFNLELPNSANLALKLQNSGLIKYNHLPLSIQELETVILGGEIDE